MQFHVNIAFWELLRKRSPQTAELVQPKFTDHRQIFDVRLFEGKQRRLDQPTDLEVFMEKISAKNAADDKTPPKPLLPRWINNILVIISAVVSTLLALLVLVLLTKHFKIKSLLATLVLSTLPPPPQATALRHDLGQIDLPGLSELKPLQTYSPNSEIKTYTPTLNNLCQNCRIFQRVNL